MPRGPGCGENQPLSLDDADLTRLRGLGERIDLAEVEEVYLPLSRLLNFYVDATAGLHRITSDFLGERPAKTPFVIGVAGSVAVGKSTTARLLKELLSRWPGTPRVELVTTDGFLYPNAELERRDLLQRKGFPESYDRRALLRFVAEVKSGKAEVERARLLPPHLRHRPRRAGRGAPARTCSSSRGSTCSRRRGAAPTAAPAWR